MNLLQVIDRRSSSVHPGAAMNQHRLGECLKMFCHALEFFKGEWWTHMVLNRKMSYGESSIRIGVQQPSVDRLIKSQVLRIQQAKNRPKSCFFCRFDPLFDCGPSHGMVSPEIISGTR